MLAEAALSTDGLVPVDVDALVEWIVYEEDGQRQSMPRNAALRDPAASLQELLRRYLEHLESLSASHDDIPAAWLPAKAIHLAPQVISRHMESCRALRSRTAFLSVDPSPHYSRSREALDLAAMLPGVSAFLPSQAEIQHLSEIYPDWPACVGGLRSAGFAEVVLKRGSEGALLGSAESDDRMICLPVAKALPVDLTGAGDGFAGAYAASRALGHSPLQAGARATVGAAMIVECSGTHEALSLQPREAEARLEEYLALNGWT